MSKFKFIVGTLTGIGVSYWAVHRLSPHKDELISLIMNKLEQAPTIDKHKMQQVFSHNTKKLQDTLETENSAEVETNFDDIKLDANQLNLEK